MSGLYELRPQYETEPYQSYPPSLPIHSLDYIEDGTPSSSAPSTPGVGAEKPRWSSMALDADAVGAYPHASVWAKFTRVILPAVIAPILLLLIWVSVGIFHSERPAGKHFANFGKSEPTHLTYLITSLCTILTGIIAWCFGSAITFLLSKQLVTGSIRISHLQTWINLADNRRDKLSIINIYGVLLTAVTAVAVATTTPALALLLTPRSLPKTYTPLSTASPVARELDLSSASFQDLVDATASLYSCSHWTTTRGLITPTCTFTNALPLLFQGGRALVEASDLVNIETFSRIGILTTAGGSGGSIPFTSISSNNSNGVDLGTDPPTAVQNAKTYNLTQQLQGSSADVSCSWASSSPLNSTYLASPIGNSISTTTNTACNDNVRTLDVGDLRVDAGICATNVSDGWTLYSRLWSDCDIIPYVLINNVTYHSSVNSSTVVNISRDAADGRSAALSAYLGTTVQYLADSWYSSQSADANLIIESLQGLFTAYPQIDRLRIYELYFKGIIELNGSFLRHSWEDLALTNSTLDVSGVFRDVPFSVEYTIYGWKTEGWLVYFALVPVTIILLTTCILNLWAFRMPVGLPAFEQSDIGSLILASGRGDLHQLDAAKPFGVTDSGLIRSTYVQLAPHADDLSKPWGLVTK